MISAAFVASFAGFGASVALLVAAAVAVGATPAETVSWIAAVSVAKGVASAGLSLWTRLPVVLAWSTPGAALIGATAGLTLAEAVGAFLLAGILIALTGLVPWLSRLVAAIPKEIAAAMLAGVLLPFVLAVATSIVGLPALVAPIVLVFLVVRLFNPLAAVLAALAMGVILVFLGQPFPALSLNPQPFIVTLPEFSPAVLIGLGVPLYLVTMASQNLPGFSVMRAYGYEPPVEKSLVVTGFGSALVSFLGAHPFNMAAITAAICLGPDVHPDKAQRWRVGVFYGGMWILIGVATPALLPLLSAMPGEVIATIAGLALIAPLIGALHQAMEVEAARFNAVVTFAVTASGMSLLGVGAAFWGLAIGLALTLLDRVRR